MVCKKCGNEIDEGNALCAKCGTPVEEKLENKTEEKNKKRELTKKEKIFCVAIICIIIIFIIIGIFIGISISKRNNDIDNTMKNQLNNETTYSKEQIMKILEVKDSNGMPAIIAFAEQRLRNELEFLSKNKTYLFIFSYKIVNGDTINFYLYTSEEIPMTDGYTYYTYKASYTVTDYTVKYVNTYEESNSNIKVSQLFKINTEKTNKYSCMSNAYRETLQYQILPDLQGILTYDPLAPETNNISSTEYTEEQFENSEEYNSENNINKNLSSSGNKGSLSSEQSTSSNSNSSSSSNTTEEEYIPEEKVEDKTIYFSVKIKNIWDNYCKNNNYSQSSNQMAVSARIYIDGTMKYYSYESPSTDTWANSFEIYGNGKKTIEIELDGVKMYSTTINIDDLQDNQSIEIGK